MLHHGNSGYSVTDSGAGERSVSSNYARHCSQERRHRCGFFCLGPLAFHSSAVGDHLRLNRQCTLAHRLECTFNHGLAFSSRPVRVGEVVRLKVKKRVGHWNGALRLGFTNRPPGGRALPPPPMAIPNLTDAGGHWAHPVPEPFCYTGSVLEFWVSQGGTIYCRTMNFKRFKLLKGVVLDPFTLAVMFGETIKNFHINFNARDDRNLYSSGDLITGKLSFDLTKKMTINSITLTLNGKAHVSWSSESSKHRRQTTSANVEYFNFKNVIRVNAEGEDITIMCEFSNASSRTATPKARLVQKQMFYSHSRVSSTMHTLDLDSKAGDLVGPHSSDVQNELTLTVPSDTPVTISNCAILEVSYLIEVSVRSPSLLYFAITLMSWCEKGK
ncbi:hypothetical protein NHX12_029088 [Muraenolepis orangiensis]|uniref:NHR domain-containing protein n=1 Tax=Muraenolepis orangiensis TaxID=630683 RepID=A0A9Q0IKV1_9TELE|nr:hypothetical protein NHX12_029088 [Muraenolepis orangiensis]